MLNTVFSCAFSFVLVNNSLSPHIHLHKLIRQGYLLTTYIYVLTTNALRYLLEESLHQGKTRGVSLPRGEETVSNEFENDSLPSMTSQSECFSTYIDCLNFFCKALGIISSEYKIDY